MANLKHFRRWHKDHYNFMTPELVSLRDRGIYIIGLFKGTDFDHKTIFGVTVMKMCGDKYEIVDEDWNKCFQGRTAYKDAQNHIKEIDKMLEEK